MIVVDLFAGGGGASEGIRQALGVSPWLAINHDEAAIRMHEANHPETIHLTEDLFRVRPADHRPRRGQVDLLWASPDCTHHSRAKGGKPRETGRRLLAWVVVEWARVVHPRVIALENVQEFRDWGPLDDAGHPIASRKGETFTEFVGALRLAGYRVEHRVLNAADYGAPTSRRRLFLVARCDGEPIVWPAPTHGPGRSLPWRTAAECIDWSIPNLSIFATKAEARTWSRASGLGLPRRPLAEATERRIAEGLRRFVLETPRPFLVQTGYGERPGQTPRAMSLDAPLGTVVASGQKHALVSAWLARHYGVSRQRAARGDLGAVGQSLRDPTGTVTAVDHHSLCEATLHPEATGRAGQVAAFLAKYYGTGCGQRVDAPLDTVTTVDRFGLVTVQMHGESYVITDIGMRMLGPRELARAQGFDEDYVLTGNKKEQVARIGNSVCPPVAAALVRSLFGLEPVREAA